MRPSIAIAQHSDAVRRLVGFYRATNPRLFGSTMREDDTDNSDLDLLFDLGGLHDELEQLLGVRVDLVTPQDLPSRYRDKVLAEATPI